MSEQLVALLRGEKTLDKSMNSVLKWLVSLFQPERSVSIDKTIDVCKGFPSPQSRQCSDLAGTKKVWATTTTKP